MLKELFGPTPVSLAGVQASAPKRRGRPPKAKTSVAAQEGHEGQNGLVEKSGKKKRTMSAAAKAKIAAAQRARWAKQKETAGPLTAVAMEEPKAKKKKRKLSPEARARIVAAQKARWAKAKRAK